MKFMLCLALLAVSSLCTTARAGFQFEIVPNVLNGIYAQSATPITDHFDIYLHLTGTDAGTTPTITDYGIAYEVTSNPGGALTLGTPTHSGGFLPAPNFSAGGSTSTIAALGNSGSQAVSGDMVFLGRVPFTIAANASGVFALSEFDPLPGPLRLSQLILDGPNEPAFSVVPGSLTLTITAVPEPMSLGLMGIALVGGAGAVRRRLARKK